jgi:Mor family transcriptional regulator
MRDSTFDLGAHYLNALAESATAVAVRVADLPPETATMIGEELAVEIAARFGGAQMYVPKGRVFQARRTEQLIVDALDTARAAARNGQMPHGEIHRSVALKFKVSVGHVYRVEKRVVAAQRAARQGTLALG